MKKLLFFCLLLCYSPFTIGQISQDKFNIEYNSLIQELKEEKWGKSIKSCENILNQIAKIDSMEHEKKVLRYIYIYSTAGLLNEKHITQEEALEKTAHLKGEKMVMPAHPFNSDCHVNCTHLSEDHENTFFTGVNNASGTQIFSFEYVTIENGIKEKKEELEGKYIILEGTLSEISVEGNLFPRFKLRFVEGDYEILNI